MKYGNEFYLQLTRLLWTEYDDLSNNAKLLFITLNELEQRYTSREQTYFYRSDADLAKDCHFSKSTLKRAKQELKNTDLVKITLIPFTLPNGKKTKEHVTVYQIMK